MKKTNREARRQHFWTIILVCVCTALIMAGGEYHVLSLRRDLMDQTTANVLRMTQQQQQAFDTFISGDRERLHSFAVNFSGADSEDETAIREKLQAFSEVDADYTVVNLETGTFYNNRRGGKFQMSREQLETYREYTGSDVLDPYTSLYSQRTKFGYYESFVFADGVRGLFQKGYDSSKVSEEFSISFYDGQGQGYVVNRQGDILLRSENQGDGNYCDNIFDMVASTEDGQLTLETFMEDLEEQKTGTAVFGEGQGGYIYTYVPVQNVEEWYLISVVPFTAVMNEANDIIQSSQTVLLFLLIIMLVFLTFLFLVWRNRRAMLEKDLELEYNKQQFDIFSTYLANNTNDVYLMFGIQNYKVEYVSANIERVLGISEEAVWKGVEALGRAKYIAGEIIGYEELENLKPGSSIDDVLSERTHKKTGERRWFRESVYCVTLQGKEKIVVYMSDRTKERTTQDTLTQALDMAQVANKAKSAFLGNVSHDIRTPMNAIMGLVTLLQQEADNPEHVMEYTQRINAASQHLLGLINDVLDMNKIEGGGATLNITEVNLAELIDELNIMIRPQTKAKEQTFRIYASTFTYEHLLGDKLRINQILINILSNAVKYTPKGGRIEMRISELPRVVDEYNRIQFEIQDNGMGMSEEYQKVIFDPFTREKSSTVNEIQGTGLGMAITKSLVDLMGGTIQVRSRLGKGTTFTLELDLRIREGEDDPEFWNIHNVSRMIVADDDESVCQNVIKAMENTGVEVDYSTSGQKAVHMMRTAREAGRPYNLILLDWKMPDLNGLETARLIRKNYPERVPILLFTSHDWGDIQQEATEVGVDHFLPKPFFMYSFKEAIKRVMGGKTQQEDAGKEADVVEGRHILVVDDIEVNRMILVKILNTLGAVCDIATNGQEAVDIFTASGAGEYDIILMDVQMPVLNGYEATRAIRASGHSSAKSVAIIAMTANAFVDDVKDALASGMDAHVSKPVVLEQLKTTLKEVLERKGR